MTRIKIKVGAQRGTNRSLPANIHAAAVAAAINREAGGAAPAKSEKIAEQHPSSTTKAGARAAGLGLNRNKASDGVELLRTNALD